jgi:hypothetical protein
MKPQIRDKAIWNSEIVILYEFKYFHGSECEDWYRLSCHAV